MSFRLSLSAISQSRKSRYIACNINIPIPFYLLNKSMESADELRVGLPASSDDGRGIETVQYAASINPLLPRFYPFSTPTPPPPPQCPPLSIRQVLLTRFSLGKRIYIALYWLARHPEWLSTSCRGDREYERDPFSEYSFYLRRWYRVSIV